MPILTGTIRIRETLSIGGDAPLLLIAGPCVIESRELCLEIAEKLKNISEHTGFGFMFKASFDKANRSSLDSYRGPGLEKGLEILKEVKEALSVPVLTDIHDPSQARPAAEVVDMLQIPAFLCRQTDLITAAASTGIPVNVKKGQFLSPEEVVNIIAKAGEAKRICITERGTTFGYNKLINDFTGIPKMRKLGVPVIFDATHSVQEPGGLGSASGGSREYVPYLARAAAAVGIDGLFIETHPDPEHARSDGPNMIPLSETESLLREVQAIHNLIT